MEITIGIRVGLLNILLEEVVEDFLSKLLKDLLYESLGDKLKTFLERSLEEPLDAILDDYLGTGALKKMRLFLEESRRKIGRSSERVKYEFFVFLGFGLKFFATTLLKIV